MELNAFDAQLAVAQAHDRAVGGFRGDDQIARKRFSFDDQGVIAGSAKILRQLAIDRFAVVLHFAGLAVHYFRRANHAAAESQSHGLMPQANS